ncbi:hypothetical protein L2E82_18452 [Cichorium intybus]|uniref:Uncharacterized protein n=1 Tax=Cichorium intybus TaxID=13427 RepID=A0ACB9FAL9_CICIN|nr:hypothetical protein L1887_35886 [Cichorium endivia]KAI3768021.1 hypothetical protein L2E82_18452 [Cichorium intybus]
MFTAIKTFPIQTKPAVSTLFTTSNNFAGKATPVIRTVRFQQASAGTEEPDNMEKKEEAEEVQKKGDVMSHSFGEGYATRSDEEGFGGVYGGNQSLSHDDEDKVVHGNHPDYDKTQGSEVKEKEKARHQTQANS